MRVPRREQISKPEKKPEQAKSEQQFGVAALFWVTFLVGLGLAYLQRIDSPDVLIGGVLAITIGIVVGGVVGWLSGRLSNAIFWATLVAAFGYMSVARDPHFVLAHRLAWATLGATTAAVTASYFSKNEKLLVCLLVNACLAELVMLVYAFWSGKPNADLQFDLYAASILGVAVAFFVKVVLWLKDQHKMPRYITATWLMIAVILGNVFS